MPTQHHHYPVEVQWSGGRDGSGTITPQTSGKNIPINVPPEFMGPGGETNPEELLTSAIAGCYSITFGIVSTNQKLPVTNFHMEATGTVEQNGATFVYKQIVLKPTITVAADASEDQLKKVEDMAHRADNYCIVTNAVRGKVEVILEPTILKG